MGYKMKGFSGFKESPMKVSDMEVINAQRRLNKIEGSYRAPGWQKAAVSTVQTLKSGGLKQGGSGKSDVAEDIYDRPAAGGGGSAAGGGGGEQKKSVGAIASEMKQGIGEAKGMMAEGKALWGGIKDLFAGSKNIDTSGGGSGDFDPNKRTITNLSGK